jgi:AmmeMemoRadiSam system protein B
VVPHAGWGYSGSLACRTIARLRLPVETVVVVGGHLRSSDPILLAPEETFATPLGDLQVNVGLKTIIQDRFPTMPDLHTDNTVEIQLPIIAYLFETARIVYVRSPPSELAAQLGQLIAEYAHSHPGVAVVGSTDLTHYGPAYGFVGHGNGSQALDWVKTRNDARFINALLRGEPESIVSMAQTHRCACSAGAAATAAAFAQACGCTRSEMIDYHTSYDVSPSESFVGYVGVGYRAPEVTA